MYAEYFFNKKGMACLWPDIECKLHTHSAVALSTGCHRQGPGRKYFEINNGQNMWNFCFLLYTFFLFSSTILELSWFPFTTRKEILQYISKYFGVEETFKRVVMSSCIFTTAIFPLESELVNTCSVISSCRALTLSLHSKWVHVTLRGESRGKQDLAAELDLGGAES